MNYFSNKKVYKSSLIMLLILVGIIFYSGCSDNNTVTNTLTGSFELTVIYTNDEHGWIEKNDNNSGAAGLISLWKEQEGYTAEGHFIILSGGDNFTGQSISTFSKGESMIEVMNAIGYDATTVGNHEFDFGVDVLKHRAEQANFPYLSCNMIDKQTGKIPDFTTPYLIKIYDGVKVAVLGLTTTSTPYETRKEYVENFEFLDYTEALNKWIPEVKGAGADIILLSCHVPSEELKELRPVAEEMGIAFIGAAHSHQTYNDVSNHLGIVEASCFMNKYAVAKIKYDKAKHTLTDVTIELKDNKTESSDTQIDDIIANWKETVEEELGNVIGYTDTEIFRYSPAMRNMVCDSWLYYFPDADISVSNIGGLRESIPMGDIKNSSVMNVLPFDNIIYELELKGSWVVDCLKPEDAIYGGVYDDNGLHFINGKQFHPDSTYKILTSNYMYTSDSYKFKQYDTEPYNTGINWRVPLIQWIEDKNTNQSNSLFNYLDTLSRRTY